MCAAAWNLASVCLLCRNHDEWFFCQLIILDPTLSDSASSCDCGNLAQCPFMYSNFIVWNGSIYNIHNTVIGLKIVIWIWLVQMIIFQPTTTMNQSGWMRFFTEIFMTWKKSGIWKWKLSISTERKIQFLL